MCPYQIITTTTTTKENVIKIFKKNTERYLINQRIIEKIYCESHEIKKKKKKGNEDPKREKV